MRSQTWKHVQVCSEHHEKEKMQRERETERKNRFLMKRHCHSANRRDKGWDRQLSKAVENNISQREQTKQPSSRSQLECECTVLVHSCWVTIAALYCLMLIRASLTAFHHHQHYCGRLLSSRNWAQCNRSVPSRGSHKNCNRFYLCSSLEKNK